TCSAPSTRSSPPPSGSQSTNSARSPRRTAVTASAAAKTQAPPPPPPPPPARDARAAAAPRGERLRRLGEHPDQPGLAIRQGDDVRGADRHRVPPDGRWRVGPHPP